jgi:hypothetical protein
MRTARAANKSVARYKLVDRSPRFLPIVLDSQVVPGSFEHALDGDLEPAQRSACHLASSAAPSTPRCFASRSAATP